MKKHLYFLFILCLYTQTSWSQDDAAARANYQKAETAYLNGKWAESLKHLQETEKLLGRKTPKVQFLKVLVYEKLALVDITALEPALAESRSYLQMQGQLPPLHQKYLPIIREIERTLPARATSNHEARVQQVLLEQKLAWQKEANKTRLGFVGSPPNKDWIGMEFGLIAGSRSRLWLLGASAVAGSDLTMDDDFNVKVYNKLHDKPDGYLLKSTILYAGYFQGIRVLPRERDFIKPFIGVRALYQGKYGRRYESDTEQQAEPDAVVLENIRSYGLDPADFYEVRTTFQSGLSLDLVIGAMLHVKGTTLFAGIDVINSKRAQFGVAFKIQ